MKHCNVVQKLQTYSQTYFIKLKLKALSREMSTTANDASPNWDYHQHQGHMDQHQQIYSTFWVWFKHLTLEIECHCWTAPVECSAPQSFNTITSSCDASFWTPGSRLGGKKRFVGMKMLTRLQIWMTLF